MKLILASQSPRRQMLLKTLGYPFVTDPADIEEVFDPSLEIDQALKNVALQKAKTVFQRHPHDVVLAADTIVVFDQKIIGKPKNKEEAIEILQRLSGQTHEVKTAVIFLLEGKEICHVETTKVTFKPLSEQIILEYVNTGSCLDKAGSYGIQETDFVSCYEGSYSNIVGLPIRYIDGALKQLQSDPEVSL